MKIVNFNFFLLILEANILLVCHLNELLSLILKLKKNAKNYKGKKSHLIWPGMVAHTCSPTTQEAGVGLSAVPDKPGLQCEILTV